MSWVARPNPGERCPRCHKAAGSNACLLCAPHLVSASLVGRDLDYLIELREAKLRDKQMLLNAVRTRHGRTMGVGRPVTLFVLTLHELSAAGTYLP